MSVFRACSVWAPPDLELAGTAASLHGSFSFVIVLLDLENPSRARSNKLSQIPGLVPAIAWRCLLQQLQFWQRPPGLQLSFSFLGTSDQTGTPIEISKTSCSCVYSLCSAPVRNGHAIN